MGITSGDFLSLTNGTNFKNMILRINLEVTKYQITDALLLYETIT